MNGDIGSVWVSRILRPIGTRCALGASRIIAPNGSRSWHRQRLIILVHVSSLFYFLIFDLVVLLQVAAPELDTKL